MKTCGVCNTVKKLSKGNKPQYYCLPCANRHSSAYKKIKRSNSEFRKKEYKKHNEYAKKRYATDIEFRLSINLRNRLNRAIERNSKIGSAVRDLGCSVQELIYHIEKQFQVEMTWNNYGTGKNKWSIDHIIALSTVDLTNPEEFKMVNHFTNLRPLWNKDQVKTFYSIQRKRAS